MKQIKEIKKRIRMKQHIFELTKDIGLAKENRSNRVKHLGQVRNRTNLVGQMNGKQLGSHNEFS